MITVDKLAGAKILIDKLTEQGHLLYADIAETAQDRARLMQEAEEREQAIDKLNGEIADLQQRNRDLELRNSRLVDDLMKAETQLNEATAKLDNVRATVAPTTITPNAMRRNNGQGLLPRGLTIATDNPPPADRDHIIR